jgi:hypothetical protein
MSDAELAAIRTRVDEPSLAPWQSFVEGPDHDSGDDFIRVGGLDDDQPDMYVSHGATPAPPCDLDFIANARRQAQTRTNTDAGSF